MASLTDWILNDVSQPLFALGMFALLALANIGGQWARRYRDRNRPGVELQGLQESHVVSAVLGLLALLMGFTFSMAADRYDDRRALVTEEANALLSAYLMAQTFAEPHRSELSELLVAYVDHRITFARETGAEQTLSRIREDQLRQTALWSAALAATQAPRDGVASSFLGKVTNAIDLAEHRLAERQAHLPTRVHVLLLIYMVITAGAMGFAFANRPQYITSGILYVLLTMSTLLIIDLDRPTTGAIVETQYAMERLQERLRDTPTSAFGGARSSLLKSPVR